MHLRRWHKHLHNGLRPRRKVSISFCVDFCKGFHPGPPSAIQRFSIAV